MAIIFNEEMETMPRSDIEALQGERLSKLAEYVYTRIPFYKEKFDELGITPEDIQTAADVQRLPFTKKTDLRDTYPFGMFAVPMEDVIRVHASSGTTGKPTVVGYTRNDLDVFAEVCARSLALAGAEPGMMFQNAYGYGLFTGGLGMHYGAERLGMTVIPVSGGNTARQVMLIQDFGPHVMACTPSYALTLADALLEEGINPADINLFSFVLGAEPWTEEMRTELEDKLQAGAVNIYGLSEIIGPGVSCESIETKNGAHIFEDHFMVEVINPETGEQVAEGEVGELVFTTLTKEALPLLRYRTGDLATVTTEPSPDGRTQARMSQIVGRVDDMLIIRGVNVFPTQIEAALVNIENITPHHRIVITREGRMDEMEVQVEVTDEYFRQIGEDVFRHHPQESAEAANRLENEIAETLKESLGLTTKVTLLAPGEGIRSQGGKLKRVVDEREL